MSQMSNSLKNKKWLYYAYSGNILVTVVISTKETNFQIILSLLSDKNSNVLQQHKVPFWNPCVVCMATINNLVTLRTTA